MTTYHNKSLPPAKPAAPIGPRVGRAGPPPAETLPANVVVTYQCDRFGRTVQILSQAAADPIHGTPDTEQAAAPSGAPAVTPDDGDEKGGKALVAWQAVVMENWPKIAERQNKPSAREVMKWLRDNGPRDTFPKEQKNRDSLCWIDTYGQAHALTVKRIGTVLSEWRKAGKIPA
jgi:hypothetical protein